MPSVRLNTPVELVNITPLSNPLISKCQIKVCYVGEQPNRNKSIITKEVATQMAQTLPGSPIVGFYNEEKGDFEGHERELVIDEDNLYFKDITRPYGFVDLGAKVWFEKFSDDGIEHEYLMTEGYLWTGQYPETQRIIDKGNNQSMELDTNLTTGAWAGLSDDDMDFFIINEAVISKLCILGEDVEPCFEGAGIEKYQFSFDDSFKNQLFSLMNDIKSILKGEDSMNKDEKGLVENPEVVEPETAEPAVEPETEPVTEPEAAAEPEAAPEEEPEASVKPEAEPSADPEPATTYNLDEIKEYVELNARFSALEAEKASLDETITNLNNELAALREFKLGVERKDKEAMIASFYMLSDEEKADVTARIDELSVSDIEKELSVICVRNKVNFNLDDDKDVKKPATTFNLGSSVEDETVPAWIKEVRKVAKEME